jgi:hypothetical protein
MVNCRVHKSCELTNEPAGSSKFVKQTQPTIRAATVSIGGLL